MNGFTGLLRKLIRSNGLPDASVYLLARVIAISKLRS
jgi:hypothetical protein